ncbi:MAG TPA: class I SAM-dependent methyltransferase [Lapillicoccus sp.]|nr:class I SAM-dependent methyltransferase [Lapillicoccus sp.]
MATTDDTPPEPPSWFEASAQVLEPLLNARSLIALLEGAEAVGLFRAMRTGTTSAELAEATGLTEQRVRDVCAALVANQVAVEDASGFRLSPAWDVLTGPSAVSPLASALAAAEVSARELTNLSGPSGWSTLSETERFAYATAVSPNPFSDAMVALVRARAATPPAVRERFRDDDRILELGCGAAGQLLCTLQAFPGVTAVGVERSADLAAEARRRSQALGVADRLDVIVGDATTVRLEGEFDVVAWSQFFFASESRAGALATAYAALRPGGLIVAPLLAHDPSDEAEPFGTEARSVALTRVVHGGWGVPTRSAAELVEEVTAAGFTDAVAAATPGTGISVVAATRP